MVMGRGLVPVVAGLVLGLVATLAFSRLMSSLLFGITDRDPFTFTAVAVVFIAVALVATYLPARQALRIEPVNALRHE
jgi:ABC-type lipoprotein release transport system permease subunit